VIHVMPSRAAAPTQYLRLLLLALTVSFMLVSWSG
jgi:hypothetical protein